MGVTDLRLLEPLRGRDVSLRYTGKRQQIEPWGVNVMAPLAQRVEQQMTRALTLVSLVLAPWRLLAKARVNRNHQEAGLPNTESARVTVEAAHDQEPDYPISVFTDAIQSNPDNVAAYLARGAAHLRAFAYDSAINDFTKAIELMPDSDSAYTSRGTANYEKAEFNRAIADFAKAIEINPRSAVAYCNLGWTHEEIGDEQQAIADYRKALELDPSLEAARDNLKLLGATP